MRLHATPFVGILTFLLYYQWRGPRITMTQSLRTDALNEIDLIVANAFNQVLCLVP
jgi:hypothetical protein